MDMRTEDMIIELRRLEKAHAADFVPTGETNWSNLCRDVADRLEKLSLDGWVSVADRLPQDEAPVLVYYGFEHGMDLGLMFVGVLTYYAFDPQPHWQHESTCLRVTHWMPLPEPPKGGTGDGEADTVQH